MSSIFSLIMLSFESKNTPVWPRAQYIKYSWMSARQTMNSTYLLDELTSSLLWLSFHCLENWYQEKCWGLTVTIMPDIISCPSFIISSPGTWSAWPSLACEHHNCKLVTFALLLTLLPFSRKLQAKCILMFLMQSYTKKHRLSR